MALQFTKANKLYTKTNLIPHFLGKQTHGNYTVTQNSYSYKIIVQCVLLEQFLDK